MKRFRFPQYYERYGEIFEDIPYGEEYDRYVAMFDEFDIILEKYKRLLIYHVEDISIYALMHRNVHLLANSILDKSFFVKREKDIINYKNKVYSSDASKKEKLVRYYYEYGTLFEMFCKQQIGVDLSPRNKKSELTIEDYNDLNKSHYSTEPRIEQLSISQCDILLSNLSELKNAIKNDDYVISSFCIDDNIVQFVNHLVFPYFWGSMYKSKKHFLKDFAEKNFPLFQLDILTSDFHERHKELYNFDFFKAKASDINGLLKKRDIFIDDIAQFILKDKNVWHCLFDSQEQFYYEMNIYYKSLYVEFKNNQPKECATFQSHSSPRHCSPIDLVDYFLNEGRVKIDYVQRFEEEWDRSKGKTINLYEARRWAKYIETIAKKIEEEKERTREENYRKWRETEEKRMEPYRFNVRNKHWRDDKVSFREADHVYIVDGTPLDSVTTFVKNCFPEFDSEFHAKRKAEALGITKEAFLEMWDKKGRESREQGTAMHKKIESFYLGKEPPTDETFELFKIFADKITLKPYRTEWAVYDWEQKIAGTIDFVDYQNGEYIIYDWKRSDKVIAKNGLPIKNSQYGEKALPPIENLDDSPYYHYALQLSLYKYILEKNYGITVSKLRLGIFHPSYNKPYVLEMPYLQNEIDTLFGLRSEVIF